MKREPIIFIIILAILALKVSSLLSEEVVNARVRPRSKPLELTAQGAADLVEGIAIDKHQRDLFLRPSADQPLPTLTVPLPQLPRQSVLLPPPLPNPGSHVHSLNLFVRPIALSGSVGSALNSGDEEIADDSDIAFDGEIEIDPTEQYRAEFDHVRLNAVTTLYGQIVNENRYELRTGDMLEFVQYDVESGRARYSVRPYAEDEYQSFGFAENLHNKIELDYRAQLKSMSAGSLSQVAVFIDWLLSNGLSESIAFDYAKDLAMRSSKLGPDDGQNWLTIAKTYEATLDYDQAFTVYSLMVGAKVTGEFANELLASGLTSGRFAHMSAPRVAMGMVLQKLNLHAAARQQFELAMDVSDGTSYAPMALGHALLREGSYSAARENLQRAFSKQANRSNDIALENGISLGLSMLAQSDWTAAVEQYQSVIELAADKSAFVARAKAGLVASQYLSGDFAVAQMTAEEAIINVGATPQLLYLRAITTGANGGDIGEVIADLNAAVAAQPLAAADYLAALAFYADAAQDTIAAESALSAALEQSPHHVYARYLQAFMAARNGDLLGAQAEYESLAKGNPNSAAMLAAYASLLLEQGNYAQANVAFARIDLQLSHQTKSTARAAAWANVYLRQGINSLSLSKHDEALSSFDYALSLDDKLYAARNARAISMYATGELDVAVAEFSYLQDALRDELEDEQYLYASLWQARMQEHDKLRRWVDDFSSERLRPGWDLQDGARAGISPRHTGQSLVIKGSHAAAARTSAGRSVPGIAFRSFAAELSIGNEHRGSAGVTIALMNRSKKNWSFEIERNREGDLSYTVSRGTRLESSNLGVNIPSNVPMTVSFNLDREPKQPVLTVKVNNKVVYSDEVVALRNPTGRMTASFFAKTAHALPVDISLDNVELIYAQL